MTIVTTFYVMSSGIMFAVAAITLLLLCYNKVPSSNQHVRSWVLLTAITAGAIQYVHFLDYKVSGIAESYFYSSLKHHLAVWLCFFVVVMVTMLTRKLYSKPVLLLFFAYTLVMSILGFSADIPIRYEQAPIVFEQQLLWGDTVYAITGPLSVTGMVRDIGFLVVLVWVVASLLLHIKQARHQEVKFIVGYLVLIIGLAIHDSLVLFTGLESIILSLSGYVYLVAVFSFFIFKGYLEMQSELRELAYNDNITQTPNRAGIQADIEALLNASEHVEKLPVCVLDLDHFKVFNDAFGHDIGNQILAKIGRRLLNFTQQRRMLTSRFDKDRFIVLVPHASPDMTLQGLANELHELVKQPLQVDDRIIELGCTIGLFDLDIKDLAASQDIFIIAERAIEHAKKMDKGGTSLYSDIARDSSLQKLKMKLALKNAIQNNEIDIVFQPQFTQHDTLYGAEVLVRWQDKQGNFIPPPEFIAIAESFGLIHDLGKLVCRKTASLLAPHRQWLLDNNQCISINVSAWEFNRSTFLDDILHILEEYQLPTSLFTLEITETVLIQDLQESKQQLKKLRESGFRVALDDFGTGYSSLSYLRELPFDILKIDKAFVDDLNIAEHQSMINGIITIAKAIGLSSVAEGVEDASQHLRLKMMGVDVLQGYHFARPMPFEDFNAQYIAPNAVVRQSTE
ncbi:putative bifunctional diguanylate cyclase/phosphodiesterase [Alteromonas gilva]|uniref:Bifunctional diguanylate cyclase/phosphodiesterase n=1 Tax=Alteromonas gilva TaxID=2987522 RepID=A0ABT5L0T3_9ALTE|nr:bifunctional diguanylate cyclase/phosphodiesterase [Alteromonas gilva]MDC8830625.1 bifunctional diguanylate cyclase/phosphodiesterase [Alteromonas gilva]